MEKLTVKEARNFRGLIANRYTPHVNVSRSNGNIGKGLHTQRILPWQRWFCQKALGPHSKGKPLFEKFCKVNTSGQPRSRHPGRKHRSSGRPNPAVKKCWDFSNRIPRFRGSGQAFPVSAPSPNSSSLGLFLLRDWCYLSKISLKGSGCH